LNCKVCHEQVEEPLRRAMGCGWITVPDEERTSVWRHPSDEDDAPTTCAGYTTQLPDVVEIASAYQHWKNGALREACGRELSYSLVDGLVLLDSALSTWQAWRAENPQGGAS
jgi:hypothetical protein